MKTLSLPENSTAILSIRAALGIPFGTNTGVDMNSA